MPARVLLEPGANRETFRREICETFKYSLGNMSIVSTIPAITDYSPPGRLQPRRTPFFIDARPILKGVLWRFAPGFRVDLDALIAEFSDEGPLGYSLVVEGGLPEHAPPHNWLQIHEGQTLTLTFCRDLLAEGEAAEESSDSEAESTSDEGSSDDDQTSPSADGPDTAPADEDTGRTPGPRRSRNAPQPSLMWMDQYACGWMALCKTPYSRASQQTPLPFLSIIDVGLTNSSPQPRLRSSAYAVEEASG